MGRLPTSYFGLYHKDIEFTITGEKHNILQLLGIYSEKKDFKLTYCLNKSADRLILQGE